MDLLRNLKKDWMIFWIKKPHHKKVKVVYKMSGPTEAHQVELRTWSVFCRSLHFASYSENPKKRMLMVSLNVCFNSKSEYFVLKYQLKKIFRQKKGKNSFFQSTVHCKTASNCPVANVEENMIFNRTGFMQIILSWGCCEIEKKWRICFLKSNFRPLSETFISWFRMVDGIIKQKQSPKLFLEKLSEVVS